MIASRPARRPLPSVLRTRTVPVVSTMAGSAVVLVPMVATGQSMPSFGLLMLLSWRLLRPEMWAAWAALPLGLFDDLMTGQMLGTSMALWTISFLVFDWIDHHVVWRDFWTEWGMAALTIAGIGAASWVVSRSYMDHGSILSAVPQAVLSILIFPSMVRLTETLDRWRLGR
jgi:rod shape-determining protein MreD